MSRRHTASSGIGTAVGKSRWADCCSGLLDYSAGQVLNADGGFALRRL